MRTRRSRRDERPERGGGVRVWGRRRRLRSLHCPLSVIWFFRFSVGTLEASDSPTYLNALCRRISRHILIRLLFVQCSCCFMHAKFVRDRTCRYCRRWRWPRRSHQTPHFDHLCCILILSIITAILCNIMQTISIRLCRQNFRLSVSKTSTADSLQPIN